MTGRRRISWENQVDLAPVFLRGRAGAGPVGRVIELVRHVCRPEAAEVTVEQVSLDGLTQARGAAAAVRLPAWREEERAAERDVRPRRLTLQGNDVVLVATGRRTCSLLRDV